MKPNRELSFTYMGVNVFARISDKFVRTIEIWFLEEMYNSGINTAVVARKMTEFIFIGNLKDFPVEVSKHIFEIKSIDALDENGRRIIFKIGWNNTLKLFQVWSNHLNATYLRRGE